MTASFLPRSSRARASLVALGLAPTFGLSAAVRADTLVALDIPEVQHNAIARDLDFAVSPSSDRRSNLLPTVENVAIAPLIPSPDGTGEAETDSPSLSLTTPTPQHASRSRSPLTPPPIAAVPEEWWPQGSDSPIAVALGAAEGTRRPDGGRAPGGVPVAMGRNAVHCK